MARPTSIPTPPDGSPGFGAIVSDCPWPFKDQGSRLRMRYPPMSIEALSALPVGAVALTPSYLYHWTVNAFVKEAIAVLEAWGFKLVTNFAWLKVAQRGADAGQALSDLDALEVAIVEGKATERQLRRDFARVRRALVKLGLPPRPKIGGGHHGRNAHELVLVGKRGRITALDRSVASWFATCPTGHSEKPEILQDNVERLAKGPYLELFARRLRPGWTCFGNEWGREIA